MKQKRVSPFTRARGVRRIAPLFVALVWLLLLYAGLQPRLAFAHANYVRSTPEAEASLLASPPQIQVWFSEAVQMPGSELTVIDSQDAQVNTEEAHLNPNDATSLVVSLPPLPRGVYFVRWQTTSAVDGHRAQGSFPFSVRVTAPVAGFEPLVRQVEQASTALQPPQILDTVLRALTLIALALVVGGFAFSPLVLPPSSRSTSALRSASALLRRKLLWASIVFAAIVFALAFNARVAQMDLISTITSRAGAVFVLRMALLAALALLLARNRNESLVVLPLCAALVLTQSLLSHSAAEFNWVLPTLTDWIHTLGASTWLGGVVMLAAMVPVAMANHSPKELGAVIQRFSPIAIACVLIVALTGIIQGASLVASLDALINTAYGRALIVKLVLFEVLIGLGAFHQYVIGPRLNAWRASAISLEAAAHRFRVSILAEVAVSVLILFAAGAMTALPPGRDFTANDATHRSTIQTQPADDLTMTLGATGEWPSPHQFVLRLTDASGMPVENIAKAVLRATHTQMDMGESEIVLQPHGNGNFVAQSSLLSMAGAWQVEAIVQRPNLPDARGTFLIEVN